jgi:AcrR family transcriptional regulator
MAFAPRSEDTRQFIIKTTAVLFNKKGYAGTSLSDLEKATALTKGSIYGNFRNKEEVALAAFDYNLKNLNDKKNALVEKAGTNREKLLASVRAHAHFPKKNGGCPIQNTGVEADDTNEPLLQRAAGALLNWKRNLVLLLEQGKKEKEFKAVFVPEETALQLIALIEGGILVSGILKDKSALEDILLGAENLIESLI